MTSNKHFPLSWSKLHEYNLDSPVQNHDTSSEMRFPVGSQPVQRLFCVREFTKCGNRRRHDVTLACFRITNSFLTFFVIPFRHLTCNQRNNGAVLLTTWPHFGCNIVVMYQWLHNLRFALDLSTYCSSHIWLTTQLFVWLSVARWLQPRLWHVTNNHLL